MKKTVLTIVTAFYSFCSYAQYLPLTGGTLTGTLAISGAPFVLTTPSGNTMAAGSSATVLGSGSGTNYMNYVYGNNPFSIWTNNQCRLTVDGSGNVGIGTANPNYKLEVAGGVVIGTSIGNVSGLSGYTNTLGISGDGGITSSAGLQLGDNSSTASRQWGIYNAATPTGSILGTLNFVVSNGVNTNALSGGYNAMTLTRTGYIGIGTVSPDEKLTVNGTIHSKEVKVDTNIPVPDYVFDNDYKLQSLNDIKAYIDKNHHLPEIPSAKEIEKNGIQLGDMNMKLLKKVEELTLYLIEKDIRDKEKDAELLLQQVQINQLKEQMTTLTKAKN